MRAEFDRQVETLVAKGYAELAGTTAEELTASLEPLAEHLPDADGDVPFVVVVPIPRERAMPLVDLGGKTGFTDMTADDLDRFATIDAVELPTRPPYLVYGVETGRDTLDVTPDDALVTILERDRSPLTLDEGLAVVMQQPEVLVERNKFSLLGSRCGDRRVTALWVSKGRPRLGWCWAGNPHSWLGSASCAGRVAAAG